MTADRSNDVLTLTADIVVAHVANNKVEVDDLPLLISSIHQTLAQLGEVAHPAAGPQQPAVPIRSSVKPDYLVCLEDGRKLKMLKRYLLDHHGMTPAEYRTKWQLPADYPMVAPNYSATRKALAQRIGLGRKPGRAEPIAEADPAPTESAAPALVAPPKRKVLRPLFAPENHNAGERAEGPVSAAASPVPGPGDRGGTSGQPLDLLCQAIARRMCVTTTYNKRSVTLAPHIVYTKHEEPFLRAVTVNQDGRRPRELKLGTFKLAGLGPVAATTRPFVRHPGYQSDEADYAGNTICALPSA